MTLMTILPKSSILHVSISHNKNLGGAYSFFLLFQLQFTAVMGQNPDHISVFIHFCLYRDSEKVSVKEDINLVTPNQSLQLSSAVFLEN